MNIVLKVILRLLITILLILAIAVGCAWGIAYAKYKVNIFSIMSSVNELSKTVDTTIIAPKQITDEDTNSAVQVANASVVGLFTQDENGDYQLNDTVTLPIMLQDMTFTDKQVCAIMNIFLRDNDLSITLGSETISLKDYDFELLQVAFSDLDTTANTVKFNIVASLSLEQLTTKMNSFPLSMLKSRMPEKIYISSTVIVTKNSSAFSYTVASSSLILNTLEQNKVDEIFTLLNALLNTGTSNDVNKIIGENFVNGLIGNEQNKGFAYTLKDIGASDFEFVNKDDEIKFVIKNSL